MPLFVFFRLNSSNIYEDNFLNITILNEAIDMEYTQIHFEALFYKYNELSVESHISLSKKLTRNLKC